MRIMIIIMVITGDDNPGQDISTGMAGMAGLLNQMTHSMILRLNPVGHDLEGCNLAHH